MKPKHNDTTRAQETTICNFFVRVNAGEYNEWLLSSFLKLTIASFVYDKVV